MAGGGGGGGGVSVNCLLVMSLLLLSSINLIAGHTYIVGGDAGWSYNINWPQPGQTFVEGGTLVFNYPPGEHNVAEVDVEGYSTCEAPPGSNVYSSGEDHVKLRRGDNYFICGVGSHCRDAGMRIVVTAE
ncbi:hypothetical protein KSP39_PZI020581 [Platanthera zijinensis]|uniref:Phytocyanin domain-containing protein n=1 Tax=Platanthera zijinensis TaxID=2320716 RepID=A0AAP0FWK6_9ASPA